MSAEFFESVTVPAGRGVGGDVEHAGDFDKSQVFPEFEVDHGPLFLRQFLQGVCHPFPEEGGVWIRCGCEKFSRFLGGTFCGSGSGGAIAGLINSGVMRHAEKKSAQVSDFGEAARFSGDAHEDLLKGVLTVRLIPGEVEEEPVQGRGMSVVDF